MIYVGLKRGTGFYSMLIRAWTRSWISHGLIAIEWEENELTVYEATASHGVVERIATKEQLKKEGVGLHSWETFFGDYYAGYGALIVACMLETRLKTQVGKPYDWTAIFYSRIFNIDRQESKKWFCFELVAWAFGMAKAWRWTGKTFEDKLERVI